MSVATATIVEPVAAATQVVVDEEQNKLLQTHGEWNDWKAIDQIPRDGLIPYILQKMARENHFWNLPEDAEIQASFLYDEGEWRFFQELLGKNAKYLEIAYPATEEVKSGKKDARSRIREANTNKHRREEYQQMMQLFNETNVVPLFTSAFSTPSTHIFYMIYWGILLYKRMDDHYHPNMNKNILNCICSLSRMYTDIPHFPEFIREATLKFIEEKLLHRFYKRIGSEKRAYEVLFSNEELLTESFWEKSKPNAKSLYDEQKNVIRAIQKAIHTNQPLLLGYKVSPGSGKTFLSAVISAVLKEGQRLNHQNEEKGSQKILLYSCYNLQVRNMVAGLCRDADQPFWMSSSYMDRSGVMKTTLRPFNTLYRNFRAARRERNEFRFGTLDEQWLYCLHETHTQPSIIISDPESCAILCEKYPERFVAYLDEITAGAESGPDNEFIRHTCRTLKIAPRQTILLSATLPSMEELASYRDHFIRRHSEPLPQTFTKERKRVFDLPLLDDIPIPIETYLANHYHDQVELIHRMDRVNTRLFAGPPLSPSEMIQEIRSNKLLISCSLIDPEGYVYMPHMKIRSFEELEPFTNQLENDPSLMRMYEPETVYRMIETFKDLIPRSFRFENYFRSIGLVKHQSIRSYIIDLFRNISNTSNEALLDAFTRYRRQVIQDLHQGEILTTNAHYYSNGKTIQVSTTSALSDYVGHLSGRLLEGSPDIHERITDYRRQEEVQKERVESFRPQREMSKLDIEREVEDIKKRYQPHFRYPMRYIVNSRDHATHFGKESQVDIFQSTIGIHYDQIVECVENDVDENIIKLRLSGVAVNDTARMSGFEKQLYNRSISTTQFFISDANIVYGTNIKGVINVSITSEYGASPISTKNSLYQLMGRAGRSGQSYSAKIVFHSYEGLNKIFGAENYEASVMESIF